MVARRGSYIAAVETELDVISRTTQTAVALMDLEVLPQAAALGLAAVVSGYWRMQPFW